MTFEQACQIYDKTSQRKRPDRKADRRLRKLRHFGYIERTWVHTESRQIVLLGRPGYRALCEAGYDLGVPFLNTIDPATFRHDTELTNVRFFLEGRRLCTSWHSERVLRHITGKRAVSDADIVWTPSGDRIAVEFERTHKNIERYRKIFKRHLHSRYAWILYILAEPSHLSWVFRRALPKLEADPCWGIDRPPVERLRFILLDKLYESGANASVWRRIPGQSQPVRETLGGGQ